jgi:hypothetical protein
MTTSSGAEIARHVRLLESRVEHDDLAAEAIGRLGDMVRAELDEAVDEIVPMIQLALDRIDKLVERVEQLSPPHSPTT